MSLSWAILFIVLLFLPLLFWVNSFFISLFFSFLLLLKKEMDCIIKFPMKGMYSFFCSIFLLVAMLNFMALFPFIFSATSHLLVSLPLSCSFWLGIIFFCVFRSVKGFLSHLVPVGTPLFLISFMVLVEILSNFIRPIALTFRLTANMIAGHLLIALIGNSLLQGPVTILWLGSSAQILLVRIELGVCLVQSYVFFTLLLLYLSDSEH